MVAMNLKCCFCNAPLSSKTETDWEDDLFAKCSNPDCLEANFLLRQTDSDGREFYLVNEAMSKTKAEEGD